MNRASEIDKRHIGLGLTAVVMGAIALGLFALPILSIPLAAVGLLFAAAGLVGTVRGPSVLWPLVGALVAGSALGLAVAIAKAPSGYFSPPEPPAMATPIGLPYVAPPARPAR